MRCLRPFITFALLVFSLVAHGGQPIQDIENAPVGAKADGGKFTADDVSEAIIRACRVRGWIPQVAAPNKIAASILVRGRHRANIEIPFSAEAFSIRYVSSENLDADPKRHTIHRNYNKWVTLLSRDITRELGASPAKP